jgi:hypothetical protein
MKLVVEKGVVYAQVETESDLKIILRITSDTEKPKRAYRKRRKGKTWREVGRREWTQEENDSLKRLIENSDNDTDSRAEKARQLAKMLNRKPSAVYSQMYRIQRMSSSPF